MRHNRMFPYMAAATVVAVALIWIGAPLASFLPFGLLLVCPLMMFFMMRNMGGMHGNAAPPAQDRTAEESPVDARTGHGR